MIPHAFISSFRIKPASTRARSLSLARGACIAPINSSQSPFERIAQTGIRYQFGRGFDLFPHGVIWGPQVSETRFLIPLRRLPKARGIRAKRVYIPGDGKMYSFEERMPLRLGMRDDAFEVFSK